jgi:predicted dinucleotide-binding enzyme
MKVGVVGTGHVGQALARGLKAAGHEVRIGSREGNKLAAFSSETGIQEGTFEAVAAFGEAVIVALKGDVAVAAVTALGPQLAGKVVLDTMNPISGPPQDGIVPYFTGPQDSLLQRLQAAVPAARFVKFFNSVGAHLMVQPKVQGGTPSMFICGNDADARSVAATLARQLGWNVEDVGTAVAGHAVEALCQLWCAPGFSRNDWVHAFAVLRP